MEVMSNPQPATINIEISGSLKLKEHGSNGEHDKHCTKFNNRT